MKSLLPFSWFQSSPGAAVHVRMKLSVSRAGMNPGLCEFDIDPSPIFRVVGGLLTILD